MPGGERCARRAVGLAVIAATGCFGSAVPQFPQDISAALVANRMRRMETPDVRLYYPEQRRELALRFLARVEGCARALRQRARIHNRVADEKMTVILPEIAFNNAFVTPRLGGYDATAVVPTFNTVDLFMLEGGLPPDPAVIGCHEITHYVHLQQIEGFAWSWNRLFGAVYTPQIGLDPWFTEGLAVHYETSLQPGVGRLAWPFWHGVFAAGVAGHHINGGDLSAFNRDFHGGNHYLFGSELVSFLARRYGEDKLWKLIDVQGRSIFLPLWVNVRFWQAFDKSLSTLIDEFAADVEARAPAPARPADQHIVRHVGRDARYARARDGTEALISDDHDRPSRLVIVSPDGRVRERNLVDVLPPRTLKVSSPGISGGMSFTADGRSLYFVAIDLDATYQASRLYKYDVGADELTVVHADLRGVGGSISPDGARYTFPRADGDHHDLAELDLASGVVRVLAVQPHGAYVAQPRFSPDGTRIAAMVFDGARFGITVFDAATGGRRAVLPTGGGPVHEPAWADDQRIVYLGTSAADWRFQVYLHDLERGGTVQVTRAPYLTFAPQAAGGRTVRFLNREGWKWTLDEVSLPARAPAPPPPAPPTPARPTPSSPLATSEPDAPIEPEAPPAPSVVVEEPRPETAPDAVPAPAPSASVAVTPIADPAAHVESDKPASQLDHLFVPRLYGPTLVAADTIGPLLGLVLAGNDRLAIHRWAITGTYELEGRLPGVEIGYSNRQLAPVTVSLSAAQLAGHAHIFVGPPMAPPIALTEVVLYRRERWARLSVARFVYDNPVEVGFSAVESYRPDDPALPLYPLQRFAGPYLFAEYVGAESTPYTGVRRAFAASAYLAAYPTAWTTAASGFSDLRGEITFVVPLPLSLRQRLTLDVRGRQLVGLPDAAPLLLAGGNLAGLLWRRSNRVESTDSVPPLSPPQQPFTEYLRGFEDHGIATNRLAVADLSYRYPFIIDWGSASTFGLLPSFFLRQIDLRLFATGALEGRLSTRHAAVGGSLTAVFTLWVLPFALQYQLARRVTDDQALVHLVMLGG